MGPSIRGDLCIGMKAIAEHLGITQWQGFHLAAKGVIPTFKMGRSVCARRSDLDRWLATCAGPAVNAGPSGG